MVKLDDPGPQKPDSLMGVAILLIFVAVLVSVYFVVASLLIH